MSADDEVLLVSRKGMAVRFVAGDADLRPMGRTAAGVSGMRLADGDEVLGMSIIRAGEDHAGQYVFTVTNAGHAKRSLVEGYRLTNRNARGVLAMRLTDARGALVGAVIVGAGDEVMAIRSSGQVTRSRVDDVPVRNRLTMGVKYVDVAAGDEVLAIARNAEADLAEDEPAAGEAVDAELLDGALLDADDLDADAEVDEDSGSIDDADEGDEVVSDQADDTAADDDDPRGSA